MFSPSNALFIFFTINCRLLKMTSNFLNANLVLNLCAVIALQSMITLIATYLTIKNLLDCFLAHQLVLTNVFYGQKDIHLQSFTSFYDLILPLYVFHPTTVFHHYLLLFLHYSFVRFSALSNIFINYIFRIFNDFYFFFHVIVFS